ncbi:hypothetical protein SAMN05428957_101328 [Oryzisolibacter propanilivorax]|uniref:Urease accessory protein UreH-like transmembrane domain-containing protein n=1 Tax=Oryzisolibacter propanilivorax TaxID=1527607 RepID=A0A1G9PCT5_9BURK|nr:sulfite exporter TauE/SafE family protein [Oryzisolibacter propanilivorax]SDL96534.1 hypothetical protein SAMN05428957_101328 [Oryzisolibacter propanilivorax]
MFLALATTVFLMGLFGGTHCLAMCAAPCGALTGAARPAAGSAGEQVVHWQPAQSSVSGRMLAFHAGRLLGYGATGAVAAFAIDKLAWAGSQSAALKPLWALTHVLIMGWGLVMLTQARQPAWLEAAGRRVWVRARSAVVRPGGVFMVGMAWALLPCGLLYTALMTAALSGSAAAGALCMVLFGIGSGLWLVLGPWAWRRLRSGLPGTAQEWGARAAGVVLCVLGGWALWMNLVHGQPAPWCVT